MRYLSCVAATLLALAAAPVVLSAQALPAGTSPVTDSLYRRAERLVMAGNGTDGRALVDSLLRASRSGTFEHAEALYWRARLAETAAEAERGYLRVSVEYPLSPHTEDALLRLGQLEMTRGNRQLALTRFERVATDFPASQQRARTYFSIARIYLDQNDLPKGCAAVREAHSALAENDVELRNQVTYQAQRCAALGVAESTEPVVRSVPRTATAPEPAEVAAERAEPPPAVRERAGQAATPPRREAAPPPASPPSAATTPPPAATTPPPAAKAPPARVPAPPAKAPAATVPPPAAKAPSTPAPRPLRPGFSVQVAAFERAQPAREMADQLRRQGFEARVDAEGAWHRVRVGHFPDRAGAAALARRLDARGIKGYVIGVGGSGS